MIDSVYREIYDVVRLIPEGEVATYGQVARLIGRPRHARQVGFALAALGRVLGDNHDVPWHRVVNSKGEISHRAAVDFENYQRILLEEEGVEFGLHGRVLLSKCQWQA